MALDQVRLADVREGQVVGRVNDLDGAGDDPAVPAVGGRVRDRDVLPGQGVQGIKQAGLVVLDRQDEVGGRGLVREYRVLSEEALLTTQPGAVT